MTASRENQPETEELAAVCEVAASDTLIGSLLDQRLQIVRLIGRGGMGSVYEAFDTHLDRKVAVKVISGQSATPAVLARFRQEIVASARLENDHIVKVLFTGDSDEGPFLVMEYLSGITLEAWIKEKGPFTRAEFLNVFRQLLRGIAHAHSQGVLHRDIKPGNIMLCINDSGKTGAKILDFGIAKILEDDQHLTQTGAILGSALYMSPEQCTNADVDARSDLYAVSCVMIYALTGTPPFQGDSALDVMYKQLHEVFSATEALTAAGPDLEALIRKSLDKNPEKRHQSAAEMFQALEQMSSETPRSSRHTRPRTALWLPVVGLSIALVFGIAWWAIKYTNATRDADVVKEAVPKVYKQAVEKARKFEEQAGKEAINSAHFRMKGLIKQADDRAASSRSSWEKSRSIYKGWLDQYSSTATQFDRINAQVNIANTFIAQGDKKTGIEMMRKLDSDKPENDLNGLTITARLGHDLFEQGRFFKAKEKLLQAEKIITAMNFTDRRSLSQDQRVLLAVAADAQADLGRLYFAMGSLVKAKGSLAQSCVFWKKLDPHHQFYHDDTHHALIQVYLALNDYLNAELQFNGRILSAQQSDIKPADKAPQIAILRLKFAQFLLSRPGRGDDAEIQIKQAMTPATDKQSMLLAYREMAEVWFQKADLSQVRKNLDMAAKIAGSISPANQPLQYRLCAFDFERFGFEKEAVSMYEKAIAAAVKTDIADGALSVIVLSNIYRRAGKPQMAFDLCRDFEPKAAGKPAEALALTILGEGLAPFDRADALRVWQKAQSLCRSSPYAKDPRSRKCLARVLGNLASWYRDTGELDKSLVLISESLEILKSENVRTNEYMNGAVFRADVLQRQNKPNDAVQLLAKDISWSTACVDSGPGKTAALTKLKQLYRKMGRASEADVVGKRLDKS